MRQEGSHPTLVIVGVHVGKRHGIGVDLEKTVLDVQIYRPDRVLEGPGVACRLVLIGGPGVERFAC